MKMNLTTIMLMTILASAATAAIAQETVRLGDMVDLESRLVVKKMTDELNKPSPNAPPPLPIVMPVKAPEVVYPTETLAIYGTSPAYEGQVTMGGQIYGVRLGTQVREYTVSAISPAGIELTKYALVKGRKKHRSDAAQKLTVFAPMIAR